MADPKPYTRAYSFTNYQADVPDQPLPGTRVDHELDEIANASRDLTARVNAGISVDINNDALEAVAAEIDKVVFVADNMDDVRAVADLGPNIELANDLFLGAHPSDPTTANVGGVLAIGATYYNTVIGESRVWSGTDWVPVAKVSTGGVLQGTITVAGGLTTFYIGDFVSIMVARNGLVLEPGVDYTTNSPTITVPGAATGDKITFFAVLKGTVTDAAAFIRQTVLTAAGITTYALDTAGAPLNLTQTNHVLMGGAPFGMLTHGVDYTVDDGSLVLAFAPAANELFHVFSIPRFTNSEAQVLLQDYRDAVAAEADRAEAAAGDADAAADRAEEAAGALDGATVLTQPSLQAVLASTDTFAAGSLLQTRLEGAAYQVAAAAATDHHMTTAGGVKLYEAGPKFTTRARLGQAVQRGALPQGETVTVGGETYIVDSSATGWGSALSDLGMNGVRRPIPDDNMFLSVHFADQSDFTLNFGTSLDGVHFGPLNGDTLPGGPNWDLTQRDPSLTWFAGKWWLFGTGAAAGSHDFVVYTGETLTTMTKYQVALGGGPYYSTTVPMPGGAAPASAIWAPQPFIVDGKMFIALSIRFGEDYTDAFGNTVGRMRTYISECLNPETREFGPPTGTEFAPAFPPNVRQWRQDMGANGLPTVQLYHQTRTDGFMGLDSTLIEHLARDYPGDTILLVPAGKGGAGFSNSEWTPGGAARLEFAARMAAALAANPGAVIEGMFWQQGEADRNNAAYQTDLTTFLTYCRNTWPALNTRPVILGQMGAFVAAGATDVNAAIAAVAATRANYGTASAAGLTDKGDALHFDANSLRTLGDRHFAAWKALRGTLPGGSGVTRIFIIAGQSNAQGTAPADTTYADITSLIDASIVWTGGRFVAAVKDDRFKRVRVYSAPAPTGPWTFHQSIGDTTRSIEAPCLVRLTRRDINTGALREFWRIYLDNNRSGPTAAAPNVLIGAPLYVEAAGDPTAAYGPMQAMHFGRAVRHGSVLNMADLPPEARRSLDKVATLRTAPRPAMLKAAAIPDGASTIRPQPDHTYYVDGAGTDAALTILDGPADRFWLAVWAADPGTGMTVSGGYVARPFLLGFGRGNDTIVEMRRRGPQGQYYPSGRVCRSEFRAGKGGAAQAVAGATDVILTWPTEIYDRGGHFNPANGRWTPPRGAVDITAQVLLIGIEAAQNNRLTITKNGSPIRGGFSPGVAGSQVTLTALVCGDMASGTDYYEVVVRGNGTGAKSVSGAAAETFVHGVAW